MQDAEPFSPIKVFSISQSHSFAVSTSTKALYSYLVKLNALYNNLFLSLRQIIPIFPALSYFGVFATISLFTRHMEKKYVVYRKGWLVDHWG